MSTKTESELLLFSGTESERHQPHYHYAKEWLQRYLDEKLPSSPSIMYIAYAEWYSRKQQRRLNPDIMFGYAQKNWGKFNLDIQPLHKQDDQRLAIEKADAIMVGGGSTRTLVNALHRHDLFPPIKARVREGGLYIATSAGSVLASPTLYTANEPGYMDVISSKTADLVPFQVFVHYYDVDTKSHHSGPFPIARVTNYLAYNPNPLPVVCLKDGSYLLRESDRVVMLGERRGKIICPDFQEINIMPGDDISFLLDTSSEHYAVPKR